MLDSSSPTSGLSICFPFKAIFFEGGSGKDFVLIVIKLSFYIAFSGVRVLSHIQYFVLISQ